jgi:hypothetical protein
MHPSPLPTMIRIQREIWPRRQTRQMSQNVTSQLARSITPARGAMPAACPRGPDADPARRRSTYNPRIMAGLARQMASARCSVRGPSCRVITATAGFLLDLDVLPKWHQRLPGHPAGPGAARGDKGGLYRRLEADGQIWQPSEWLGVPETQARATRHCSAGRAHLHPVAAHEQAMGRIGDTPQSFGIIMGGKRGRTGTLAWSPSASATCGRGVARRAGRGRWSARGAPPRTGQAGTA